MAGNLTDVYSIVFNTLGEEKTVQSLIKIKNAADEVKTAMNKLIQNNPNGGLAKAFGAEGYEKQLAAAYKALAKQIEMEKKAQNERLKMIDVEQKVSEKIDKEAQKRYQAEANRQAMMQKMNQSIKQMLLDEQNARLKAIDVEQKVSEKIDKEAQKRYQIEANKQAMIQRMNQSINKMYLDEQKAEELKRQAAQKTADEIIKNVQRQLDNEQKVAQQKAQIAQKTTDEVMKNIQKQIEAEQQLARQKMVSQMFLNSHLQGNLAPTSYQPINSTMAAAQAQAQAQAQAISQSLEQKKTAEMVKQTSEGKKQVAIYTKLNSLVAGTVKFIQRMGTSSFVFQRMFDSITRTVDEWSKANVALTQFRSQAGFENMNKQLDQTVKDLDHAISKYEMIPAINKAKMLGFDFSGNKLSETLQMTTKVAQMFNIDPTKAFADFTVAITKASPIIMDNVGVLLRLEEAYRLFYETQYKGTKSFDQWEKSLSQAEKRSIYYTESMKQFSKKTEGFVVVTNQAQSAIMRLRDAWLGLGNDLADSGGLNPAIGLLERVVGLFESLGRTVYDFSNRIQAIINQYPWVQQAMNYMTGSTGVGFVAPQNMADVQQQYNFQLPEYEKASKQKESVIKGELNIIKNYREEITKALEKEKEFYNDPDRIKKGNALWKEFEKGFVKGGGRSDASKGYVADEYNKFMDRELNAPKKIKDLTAALAELNAVEKEIKSSGDKSFNERFMQSGIWVLGDLLPKSTSVVKNFGIEVNTAAKETGTLTRVLGNFNNIVLPEQVSDFFYDKSLGDRMAQYQTAAKLVNDYNKAYATNSSVISGVVRNYKTEQEAMEGNVKIYRDNISLTKEQFDQLQKLDKLGAKYALNVEAQAVATQSLGDQKKSLIRDLLLQEKATKETDFEFYNPQIAKQAISNYEAFVKNYGQVRNLIGNEIVYSANELSKVENELTTALENVFKGTDFNVKEYLALYKKTQEAGAVYGQLVNPITPLDMLRPKETKTRGRQKAPKEFWDKWYEMNRTAFTEALPEGITRDIEQARLDWYDQTKNLEMLKKDILKAKKEGRLDPEERLKFFGKSGNKMAVFQTQMKFYRETIESNYKTMLDNLATELKRKQAELNPFQQFAKDAKLRQLEEKGKRFSENTYSAVGGYLTPMGRQAELTRYETNINRIKYADEIKKISNERLETEKKIKQELQAQEKIDVQRLQSENEWQNTTDFHIRLEALKSEYKAKEVIAMEKLNEQEKERIKWAKNILLDNSLTLSYLDKQNEKTRKHNKMVQDAYEELLEMKREDLKLQTELSMEYDVSKYIGLGIGETSASIATKMGGIGKEIFQDIMKSDQFSQYAKYMKGMQTDTNFKVGIDTEELKKQGLGDEFISRLKTQIDVVNALIQAGLNKTKPVMEQIKEFWLQGLAEMWSGIANFAGNAAWNMITGEDVSGVQALKEARKTDLKDQQEQLKNKTITQETYAKRAYEIEKTYIENKKAAEKNYRNEQWKQLGAVFWAQGLGYVIKGGIDLFMTPALGKAELVGGAALMGLGAMLGYGRGGKTAMSKSNLADESKATRQQDINVYVDNKIFEDKRQLRKSINEANY